MRLFPLLLIAVFFTPVWSVDTTQVPSEISSLLDRYCISCHGAKKQKGDIRLDTISTLKGDAKGDLFNTVREIVYFENMPPEGKDQPTTAERKVLDRWLARELAELGPLKLEEKLQQPDYGNRLDHQKLFSGEYKNIPGFTYDRRWMISEYIFNNKFSTIFNQRHTQFVGPKRRASILGRTPTVVNLTNPFLLPTNSGVRYYANETLGGGHLLTMLTNAKETASAMMAMAKKNNGYLPGINGIMDGQWNHERQVAERKIFLNNFIERMLIDIYKDKHQSLLPQFVAIKIDPPKPISNKDDDKKAYKKSGFASANPGNEELAIIYKTMRGVEKNAKNDKDLIDHCEKAWFFEGVNERKIASRITFLRNYMEEWRALIIKANYAQRIKEPVYKELPQEEMMALHKAIRTNRKQNDTYADIIEKCVAYWDEQFQKENENYAKSIEAGKIDQLVEQLFLKILERSPTSDERSRYQSLARNYFPISDAQQGIDKLIQSVLLRSDFVYRYEFGQGQADEHGRRMLSSRDASYALAYALTDSSPDKELAAAAQAGKLNTREDYRREVTRMLARRDQLYLIDETISRQRVDSYTNIPIRKLRFFREFFGYPNLLGIFKDNKRFGGNYENSRSYLVSEADRLIESILRADKNVFEELLTSDKFYVFHSGDNDAMKAASDHLLAIYEHFKDTDWKNFTQEDFVKHREFLEKIEIPGIDAKALEPRPGRDPLRLFKEKMASYIVRFDKGQTSAPPFGPGEANQQSGNGLDGAEVAKFYNIALDNWNYPTTQPAKIQHRKGMLTHPAWLIAHAKNTETDPIHRGKWIREKLLAGSIPDVPITVDAVIPEDHHKTLRQRLDAKTNDDYCMSCHKLMNPLGLTFEIYDDFGRYRQEESLEHPDNLVQKGLDKAKVYVDLRDIFKTLPIDSKGNLAGTDDKALDGDVNDALELIDRLGKSTKVRQSIIRYAFRYFLGRNEMLSDSKTLIDADQAYLKSGGSFDAVIISLLTSDSFIYRKALEH